ncbi:hypothetical protein Bca101_074263 [Brassica carinata]
MANNVASLERAKAIINGLTMVPAVGDIYSELSAEWLAKPEDAYKVGDRIDVKLIEVNEKGQLRLSVRALLPESESGKDGQTPPPPTSDSTKDKGSPRKYVNTSSKDRGASSKVASGDMPKKSNDEDSQCNQDQCSYLFLVKKTHKERRRVSSNR